MTFETFDLHPDLMAGVRDMGYRDPTPIQAKAIPAVMEGKDVIGVAQTGTGKTAAFLLPILHRLMSGTPHTTRALILAPTRELALQIDEVRLGLTYHTSLSGCCVYGGADMNNQTRALRGNPDVVTATPGRLLDHLWHGLPKFEGVEVLVLDEADRMLDMGFLPDLEKILRRLPEKRQNLLFSATMPREIERLAREMMVDPFTITVGPKARPVERIDQQLHVLSPAAKSRHLLRLVDRKEFESVLVFTRTKTGANQVFNDLRKARIPVAVIHGDRAQEERIRSLEAFRHGQIRVLVATDVASRGIDVDGISHVINFDVPRSPDDYVHRIGRTGRAGESGHAITFVTREEERDVRNIERQLKMSIPRHEGGRAPERSRERDGRGRDDDRGRRPRREEERSRGRDDDRGRRSFRDEERSRGRDDGRRPRRDDDRGRRPFREEERARGRDDGRRPRRDDDRGRRPFRDEERSRGRDDGRRPRRDDDRGRRPFRDEERSRGRDDDRRPRRDDDRGRRPFRDEERSRGRDDGRRPRRDDDRGRRPVRDEERSRGRDDDRRPRRDDDRGRRSSRDEERSRGRDDGRRPRPDDDRGRRSSRDEERSRGRDDGRRPRRDEERSGDRAPDAPDRTSRRRASSSTTSRSKERTDRADTGRTAEETAPQESRKASSRKSAPKAPDALRAEKPAKKATAKKAAAKKTTTKKTVKKAAAVKKTAGEKTATSKKATAKKATTKKTAKKKTATKKTTAKKTADRKS
ncbi:MAG: DEAD/DEAH box helicase, partial [Planctomycetota bacterium JB042]